MKFMKKNILINSFIISFIVSFVTVYFVFPQLNEVLYTSITSWWNLNVSWWFFVKVLLVLWGQTSILWWLFYIIAKKIFLKNNT